MALLTTFLGILFQCSEMEPFQSFIRKVRQARDQFDEPSFDLLQCYVPPALWRPSMDCMFHQGRDKCGVQVLEHVIIHVGEGPFESAPIRLAVVATLSTSAPDLRVFEMTPRSFSAVVVLRTFPSPMV